MRVLVLGATGMLGHKLCQVLNGQFETYGTVRSSRSHFRHHPVLSHFELLDGVTVEDCDSVARAIQEVEPAVVVNCIGVIKQRPEAQDRLISILVNALFPHRLAQLCQASGARLIHISTDCVFSGRTGNYVESDVADADDLYGRTKYLGEVDGAGCLTLRTSVIGRELGSAYGLLEWFLAQQGGTIQGYKRAIFSGLTTLALADVIAQIITAHPRLHGVWHVGGEPISKFDLLALVKQIYGLDIDIEPDETAVVDRSLNSDRFRRATGIWPPSWPDMIRQMYHDPTPYAQLRRTDAE